MIRSIIFRNISRTNNCNMNFLAVFNNKTIRIPLLQRDYVQGSKESVISPFIDSLLDNNMQSDLNYIYGYTEDGCFIPVDGQQRLTTLWLLYLYAAARANKMEEFNIELSFLSREYANDFCDRLRYKIEELLQIIAPTESLDTAIADQYWYIASWGNNATVGNMLLTLKYIHRKCTGCTGGNAMTLWNYLKAEDNISFSFLDMSEDYGLDDDIYIKMNGRGRPLSIFENLKSWMDEKVTKAIKNDDELWLHDWSRKMDNLWTQFFWDNRNQNQSHPEEIDDEQLFCFCNLIILYWMEHKEQMQDHIRKMRESAPFLYEQLLALFPQHNDNDSTAEIVGYLFDKIQKGDMPSLAWIERLNLLPLDFLKYAYDSINQLSHISSSINKSDIYIGTTSNDVSPIYDLALSEGTYGRTLPLLHAVLMIKDGIDEHAWLRECRNLILNTDIQKEKLPDILLCLNTFAECSKKKPVYEVLQKYNKEDNDFLRSFERSQVNEEIKKSGMSEVFFPQMEKMENERFFSGRIRSLFRLLEHEDGIKDYTLIDFVKCSNILCEVFYAGDGRDGGIRAIYDRPEDRLLRRTLMACPPYFYGMYRNAYWCFCNNLEEWRIFLNSKDSQFDALRFFIIKMCLPAIKNNPENISNSILRCMSEVIELANSNYEEKLELDDNKDKFNLHFIHHVGVWGYMVTNRCSWPDNDDSGMQIFLKTSNGNNSGRMELRTYSLYLDYCDTSVRKDLIADRNGWSIAIWPKGEDTCLYFDAKIEKLKTTLAIDVLHHRRKENDYYLKVFVRPNHEEENDIALYKQNNQNFFRPYFEQVKDISFHQDENGRFIIDNSYSRDEIIRILRRLFSSLKDYINEFNAKSN